MWFPFITPTFMPTGNPFLFANPGAAGYGTAYARAMFPLAGNGGGYGYGANGNYAGALGKNLGNSIQNNDGWGMLGSALDLFSIGLGYSAQYRAMEAFNNWTARLFVPTYPNITIT